MVLNVILKVLQSFDGAIKSQFYSNSYPIVFPIWYVPVIHHSVTITAWLSGIVHTYLYYIYSEQVKGVPDKLDSFLAKKHYLHATDLIVSAGKSNHLLYTGQPFRFGHLVK
jgi:hypothetical protein